MSCRRIAGTWSVVGVCVCNCGRKSVSQRVRRKASHQHSEDRLVIIPLLADISTVRY